MKTLKTLFIAGLMLAGAATSKAQSAKLTGDTLTYNNSKYYAGKVVQIWYGSKPDKNFAFIWKGNILTAATLTTADSKHFVIISKFLKSRGKYHAIGQLQDVSGLEAKRITIDIEGAVDNKELKEETPAN